MFHSTNNKSLEVDFKTAVLQGQAFDKGLYMLNEIPHIKSAMIDSFKNMDFIDIAYKIISKFTGNLISKELLSSGISVLALDARFYRKEKNDTFSLNMQELPWMFFESIIDYRRAIDYLETRPKIDINKLGVIGYSIGGVITFALSAVETRIKVAAACVTPNLQRLLMSQNHWNKEVKNQLMGVNPYNFARFIKNIPFLMLMGRFDSYCTVEEANRLYHLVESSHKKIILYNRGHLLPINYVSDAVKWLKKYLN